MGNFKRVTVAVIDTGVDYLHKDLAKNMDTKNCVMTVNGEIRRYTRDDLLANHGTAIAGVIAGVHNDYGVDGVAAGYENDLVSIMGIDVFKGCYRRQKSASTDDCVAGIHYAVEHGAKVIQMCLGHFPDSLDATGLKHDDAALEAAIDEATAQGCIVVTSAGNNNKTRTWYPSDFSNTLSTINLKKYKNAYSRNCKKDTSNYGKRKDVSAPGASTYTTLMGGTYKTFGGTSAASPHCAGVVALMCYIDPTLTIQDVREILSKSCDDLYTPGKDIYTGYGKVNAYRAVALTAKRAGYTGFPDRLPEDSLNNVKVKVRVKGKKVYNTWSRVKRANYYVVYRKTGSTGSFKRIKKTSGRKFIDKKASVKKKNYYQVDAFGTTADGKKTKSMHSNEVKAMVKE